MLRLLPFLRGVSSAPFHIRYSPRIQIILLQSMLVLLASKKFQIKEEEEIRMPPQHVSTLVGDFEGASPSTPPSRWGPPRTPALKTKKIKNLHTTRAQFDCIRRRDNKVRRPSESQHTAKLRKTPEVPPHAATVCLDNNPPRPFPCLPPSCCFMAVQLCGSSLSSLLRRPRPSEFPLRTAPTSLS